jgi:vacuolar-type H+-ATPase subunit H
MENPIQEVLAAERDANREVLEARAAAEQAVAAARRSAKDLLEKNEQRLKNATARFEQHALQAREAQAAEVRRAASERMQSRHAEIDSRLAELVAAAFEENWPSA